MNEEITKRFEEHWEKFIAFSETRNQNVRFLNKNGHQRNIMKYINDSVDRMNEFHIKPDWKEDWQQNVFDPITRNKVISILSILAGARLKAELIVKNNNIFNTKNTEARKKIYKDLLDAANIKNKEQQQFVWELYTGLSQGTVIGFESWMKDTREIEYTKEFDPNTGEAVTDTIKYNAWDDVYGEIVPIEEFYPETIWVNVNDFKKKVHRCFWAQQLTIAQFKDKFGKFKNASTVEPAATYTTESGDLPWGISSDTKPENVFVLHYFDEKKGKMGIWANGIEIFYGAMPWNHNKLPFWISITEPIHQRFLYGKSLPDKLMGMQDVNNASLNGMLDQLFISLNSPIFTDGEVDIDEGYLQPGRIITGTPGSKAQRLSLGGVDPTAFNMITLIKKSMEEASISNQAQGIPTGGRKTKFEVQQLQEGALNIAGLALQLFEGAMEWKYLLRMYNILQYYSMPSQTKSGKNKFKFIEIENTELLNKKKGKKLIQIVGSQTDVPSKEELQNIAGSIEGKQFDPLETRVEPIVITRDYLMNKEVELEIRVIPNSSVKDSEIQQTNKNLAFYQSAVGNPQYDQEKLAKLHAEAFNQSEDIVKEGEQQAQEQGGGMPGMPGMKGMGNQPDLDLL